MATAHLSSHHSNTRDAIFSHPTSGNIESHAVLTLLQAAGTVVEEHNGHFKVTLGDETETLRGPHGKDVDEVMIGDLRRKLAGAGYGPHAYS